MKDYIVDIGGLISGRTIEIEAINTKDALRQANEIVDKNKLEKVIQVRDDMGKFYYNYEFGIIEN